jgi:hypothetical protein
MGEWKNIRLLNTFHQKIQKECAQNIDKTGYLWICVDKDFNQIGNWFKFIEGDFNENKFTKIVQYRVCSYGFFDESGNYLKLFRDEGIDYERDSLAEQSDSYWSYPTYHDYGEYDEDVELKREFPYYPYNYREEEYEEYDEELKKEFPDYPYKIFFDDYIYYSIYKLDDKTTWNIKQRFRIIERIEIL